MPIKLFFLLNIHLSLPSLWDSKTHGGASSLLLCSDSFIDGCPCKCGVSNCIETGMLTWKIPECLSPETLREEESTFSDHSSALFGCQTLLYKVTYSDTLCGLPTCIPGELLGNPRLIPVSELGSRLLWPPLQLVLIQLHWKLTAL